MPTYLDLKINYYALVIAILLPATPELAFEVIQSNEDPERLRKYRRDITDEDCEDMCKLKAEMTYKELAEVYCILGTRTITNRIEYIKNKKKEALKAVT